MKPFAFLSLVVLAGPGRAQEALPLPFQPVGPGPVAGSIELVPDAELIDLLSAADLDRTILRGFPNPKGRLYDLALERVRFDFSSVGVFVDGVASEWDPGNLTLWRGEVVGVPQSAAFLILSSRGSYGWVFDGLEYTHLSAMPGPGGDWSQPGARILPDEALDSAEHGQTDRMRCMAEQLTAAQSQDPNAFDGSGGTKAGMMGTLECTIAVETDYQLYQLWGDLAAEQNYVMALLAAVSSRYEEQIGTRLTYPYVQFYTDPNDPWQAPDSWSSTLLDLLKEFRAAWQGAIPGGARLGHFLSGAKLGGGLAYLDVLCSPSFAFGVSANMNGKATFPVQQKLGMYDFYVMAHEIGHNFGSLHTHQYCPPLDECAPPASAGPCQTTQACVSNGTLMSYCHLCPGATANITMYFHPTVVDLLRSRAEACLGPNTAPVADAGGPYLVPASGSVQFDGSGSYDPDGDPLTRSWAVDDGGAGSISGRIYTAGSDAGIHDVTLTVFDGQEYDTDTSYVVVYDPTGGFVTGGGWFTSAPGAYKPDPGAFGPANFGFVAKYKKGAKAPDGNTEFQFHAGNLNFHSSEYEWLVVSQASSTAQFKGSGTINGAGSYRFMIWATDEGQDAFRIRIWTEDASGNEVDVYDNGYDQPLDGGQILVHAK